MYNVYSQQIVSTQYDFFLNICNKTFLYIPKPNDKIVALTTLSYVG